GRPSLRHCLWGIFIAAAIATVIVLSLAWPDFDRPHTRVYNIVSYSNLMLLFAVVSLFSIWWPLTKLPRLEQAMKLTITALTLIGFILTQTRTGWLAIPAYVLLGVALATQFRRPWRSVGLMLGILSLAVAIGLSSNGVRWRISKAAKQVVTCQGDRSTVNNNVCARIQLWRAAGDMFV